LKGAEEHVLLAKKFPTPYDFDRPLGLRMAQLQEKMKNLKKTIEKQSKS